MLEINFAPFPILETERMVLRRITLADAPDLFEIRSNPKAMHYLDRLLAKTIKDVEDLIQRIEQGIESNSGLVWGMSLKTNPKLIGTLGYHNIQKENHRAELGYMLHPDFWHQGLMTEGVAKVLAFGFGTLRLHTMEGHVNPANAPSIQVLTRQGFVKEGYFRENIYYEGKFLDTEVYGLISTGS